MSASLESIAAAASGDRTVARRGAAAQTLSMRQVTGDEWDRVVAAFDAVCQEQLYVFAVNRWPSVRQEPVVFERDGQIVGGALIMIQPLPLKLGAIAVSKWGPLLKHIHAPDARMVYAGMIEALIEHYAQKRNLMISILPQASIGAANGDFAYLMSRGFRRGSVLAFPNRYIVNLRLGDAEQRKSLHQKWRYHLNKAEKAGLSFEHAGPERLPEFDALYHAMTGRKQFADHSAYETVPALMAIEDPALRPELFFVRHEGQVVAGAIIFKSGDRAVYLYGATNEAALPLRAGYFIHWQIIRWLRDNTGATWYDLGGTDGFQGLHQFKKGMVGEAGVIQPVPPVANFAARPLPYIMGAGAFWARDFVHVSIRKIRGLLNARTRPTQDKPGEAA